MSPRTICAGLAALVLLAGPAMAQQPAQPPGQQSAPPVDPRISSEAIAAMQALLNLKEAQMRAFGEDARKRESEWAEYSRPLWQTDPPATAAK